jgi:hypothetical protein
MRGLAQLSKPKLEMADATSREVRRVTRAGRMFFDGGGDRRDTGGRKPATLHPIPDITLRCLKVCFVVNRVVLALCR